jgi:hypothetical protein
MLDMETDRQLHSEVDTEGEHSAKPSRPPIAITPTSALRIPD